MMSKPLVVGVVAAAMTAAAVVSLRAMRSPAASLAPGAGTVSNGGSGGGAPSVPGHVPAQVSGPGAILPTRSNNAIHESRGGNGTTGDNITGSRSRVAGHRQTRAKNGSYMTIIARDFTGTGIADVKDDRVSINADVLTSDGRAGKFVANNLTVDGPYFFGSGTVLGESVQVSGRVDAARASRLLATFSAGDGKAARMVGNLPAALDAGDDNWEAGGQRTRMDR